MSQRLGREVVLGVMGKEREPPRWPRRNHRQASHPPPAPQPALPPHRAASTQALPSLASGVSSGRSSNAKTGRVPGSPSPISPLCKHKSRGSEGERLSTVTGQARSSSPLRRQILGKVEQRKWGNNSDLSSSSSPSTSCQLRTQLHLPQH